MNPILMASTSPTAMSHHRSFSFVWKAEDTFPIHAPDPYFEKQMTLFIRCAWKPGWYIEKQMTATLHNNFFVMIFTPRNSSILHIKMNTPKLYILTNVSIVIAFFNKNGVFTVKQTLSENNNFKIWRVKSSSYCDSLTNTSYTLSFCIVSSPNMNSSPLIRAEKSSESLLKAPCSCW